MTTISITGNPVFVLKDKRLSLQAKGAFCMMRFLCPDVKKIPDPQFPQSILDELMASDYLTQTENEENGGWL